MKEIKASTVRRRYARLPLALALGAMVLTPALIGLGASETEASVAGKGETSITLSGDARLRGFWREDAKFGNVDDDQNRQLQHRMRLYFDAKAAGGTSLHARLLFAANDSADRAMYQWGGDRNSNVGTDYFFVRVPVGDVTVIAGRQAGYWGHKLKSWDSRPERLTAFYRVNEEVSAWTYYQKDKEASPADLTGVKDDDQTRYAVGMRYNTPDLHAAVQVRHTEAEWTNGNSGQELFAFTTYKVDALTVKAEVDFTFGDRWKGPNAPAGTPTGDPVGSNVYAMFLGLEYAMGDTTLTAGGVLAKNGWVSGGGANFDYITMFYNTDGGHGLGHSNVGWNSDDREYAIGVGASHKLSPELTLGGKLAYLNGKDGRRNLGTGDNWKMATVDASLAYKINASTTYHVDGIYAKPSSLPSGWENEPYWGLSHRFEIAF
ncbi:hypothetical protein [Desulfurivibrio sp. C05AmB]|uniref:hypothetical protein n=1 Tax=Desulfurivibrio sp. C05AmB TaxID=3374371 RepID=UPI00376EA8F9